MFLSHSDILESESEVKILPKTSEELAAILLSGYLANSHVKNVNAKGAAKMLADWTKAIEETKNVK